MLSCELSDQSDQISGAETIEHLLSIRTSVHELADRLSGDCVESIDPRTVDVLGTDVELWPYDETIGDDEY